MNNRVIYSKNNNLTDISSKLSTPLNGDFSFSYEVGDYFYIGSRLPFNHFYVDLTSFNLEDSEIQIETWSNNKWIPVVDIMDQTNGFKKSGHVEFTPNKSEAWSLADTNYEGIKIEELEDIIIYQKYWTRFSFNSNMTEDVEINFIGNKFCDDDDLKVEYPDLVRSSVLASFETGKTSWKDQHFRASEILIKDLIDMMVIKEKGQILNWRDYTDTCIHKVAEIAFNSFGDSYFDNSVNARREYQDRLSRKINRVDLNRNGIEDPHESFNESGFMKR